jgi:hypothetical protein
MIKSGYKIPSLAIIILTLMMTGSCELFSDNNEDCDATKMIELKEPIIYLRAEVWPGQLAIDSDLTYKLRNATKIEIKGSIQKVYCSGKKSGYFTYNPNFFPTAYDDAELVAGLFLPQPYQYKFENDLDKLIVIITCKAWFSDGKIFEMGTITEEFFYKDIKYEVNEMRYYFKILLSTESTTWRRVTS